MNKNDNDNPKPGKDGSESNSGNSGVGSGVLAAIASTERTRAERSARHSAPPHSVPDSPATDTPRRDETPPRRDGTPPHRDELPPHREKPTAAVPASGAVRRPRGEAVRIETDRMKAEIERMKAEEKRKAESAKAAAERSARRNALRAEQAAQREQREKLRRERADLARAERRELSEKASALFSSAGKAIRAYAGYFALYFLIISAVAAAAAGISLLTFGSHRDNAGLADTIVYTIGNDTVRKQKSSQLIKDGVVYTDLGAVARLAGMSVSGDISSLKLSTSSGEYALFEQGSRFAVLNGARSEMEAPAVISRNSLLVPLSFVEKGMTGISVTYTHENDGKTDDSGAPLEPGLISGISIKQADADGEPVSFGFLLKPTTPLISVSKDSIPSGWLLIGDDNIVYTYKTDLSSYQKYMNPTDRVKYAKIINANEKADASFIPEALTAVLNVKPGKSFQMDKNAEKALEAMFTEMAAEGFTDIYVNRAYVSYKVQDTSFGSAYYNERYYYKNNFSSTGKYFSDTAYAVLGKNYLNTNYINKTIYHLSDADARRVAVTYCAEPGASDHQTGLSADIWGKDGSDAFGKTEAYKWLKENAHKFGFIERYPAGKEKVTGFTAEPYHWRFVGQYHAAVMNDYGFCLEEYVAYITDGRQ